MQRALVSPLTLLVACAGLGPAAVRVEPLATDAPGVSAYALYGRDAQALRETAQQLCPQGAQWLRMALPGVHRPSASSNGTSSLWLMPLRLGQQAWDLASYQAAAWLQPPAPEGQLLLQCEARSTEALALASGPAASASASASVSGLSAASVAAQAALAASGASSLPPAHAASAAFASLQRMPASAALVPAGAASAAAQVATAPGPAQPASATAASRRYTGPALPPYAKVPYGF